MRNTTLETRSLDTTVTCPACGARLRRTEDPLTVECLRSNRRMDIDDVIDEVMP